MIEIFGIITSVINGVVHVYQQQLQQENFARQKQLQQELEELRHRNQQQLQQENFARQKQLQQELADYNRQTQLQIAAEQRKTALESVEANKLFENWPLRIVPSLILNSHQDDRPIPLHIIPVPPVVEFDQFTTTNTDKFLAIEKYLAEGLRQFLHPNYPLNKEVRPVELLDGAWDSNRYHGGSSIKALFSMLRSEPILILESEIDGDYLNFRLAYWGLGQDNYSYAPVISRLPFREIVYESAKNRARKWKTARDQIVASGQNPKEINELDTYNLEILEQESAWEEAGIDISELPPRYKVSQKDFEAFAEFLVTCNCLVAGWIADVHHLMQGNITPLLPQLLPELAGDAPPEVVESILSGYSSIYESLETERLEVIPELLLEFANSLKDLSDKSWAKTQVDNSVKSWLKLRGMRFEEGTNLWEAIPPSLISSRDLSYIEEVMKCLRAIEDSSTVGQIQGVLSASINNYYQSAIACVQQGDYLGAIAAIDQAIRLNPNEPKFQAFRQKLPKIDSYSFNVITVNSRGEEIKREHGNAQYFAEDLGNNVSLEMVSIPSGNFLMGTDDAEIERLVKKFEWEYFRWEKPQHEVKIQSFWMGKYPVTQAQWKIIASRTDLKVDRNLNSNPSTFKGDHRPVEKVSWYDANEFCGRLSKLTGKIYQLPSEAEWEYACRAGTKTPFHFGETLTTNLANYDGNYPFVDEPKGEYRNKTTPVGSFPPNTFGLYDMHGNVWEWCGDDWEENYNTPRTQDYYQIGDKNNFSKVVRGGCWYFLPWFCRCALRNRDFPDNPINFIVNGFRVVSSSVRTP